jgi:hypothetical protein
MCNPISTCPCAAMEALKLQVAHLKEQTEADASAMHTLHERCLEARKKWREAQMKHEDCAKAHDCPREVAL